MYVGHNLFHCEKYSGLTIAVNISQYYLITLFIKYAYLKIGVHESQEVESQST